MPIEAPAFGESAIGLVSEGNRAFQNENYDGALEAYEKASVDAPESPLLYFNKGTAFYMKGEYEKASELFEQAALKSKDIAIEARSFFNMGNCSFRESERQRDSDLPKSLKELQQGIIRYQKALKLDPTLEAAARNIEVTRLTMKQIMGEIKKKEEEAQKQQEKAREIHEKLTNLLTRQEKLVEATNALEEEKRQEGDEKKIGESADRLAQDQAGIKGDTEALAAQMDSSQSQPGGPVAHPGQPGGPMAHIGQPSGPMAQVSEHVKNSIIDQDRAKMELEKEALAKALESEQEAVEDLKMALEAMKGDQKDSSRQDHQEQQKQEEQQGQQDKQEQQKKQGEDQDKESSSDPQEDKQDQEDQQAAVPKDEDAHNILNEERENKENRQIKAPGKYRVSDKDW